VTQQRNKISTVYFNSNNGVASASQSLPASQSLQVASLPASQSSRASQSASLPASLASRNRVTRSESVVTVSGATQRSACHCAERVTVNGQHHCCDAASEAERRHGRLHEAAIIEVNSPPESQPSSLIDI
jgi:hypothetical protein